MDAPPLLEQINFLKSVVALNLNHDSLFMGLHATGQESYFLLKEATEKCSHSEGLQSSHLSASLSYVCDNDWGSVATTIMFPFLLLLYLTMPPLTLTHVTWFPSVHFAEQAVVQMTQPSTQ